MAPEKGFVFLKHRKQFENKKFMSFSLYSIGMTRFKTAFVEPPSYNISISLTIEIQDNIDTFRVTNKQYSIFLIYVSTWHKAIVDIYWKKSLSRQQKSCWCRFCVATRYLDKCKHPDKCKEFYYFIFACRSKPWSHFINIQ